MRATRPGEVSSSNARVPALVLGLALAAGYGLATAEAKPSALVKSKTTLAKKSVEAQPAEAAAEHIIDEMPLSDLMPKVFAAYGGKEGFAKLDSNYTFLGQQKLSSLTDGTASALQFRQLRKDQNLRIDLETGTAPTATVFDGVHAWKSVGQEVTEITAPDDAVLASERDHNPSVLVHYEEPQYTFTLSGRTQFRAQPVYAIEVRHREEKPFTVYVDQKNYLVDGIAYGGIHPRTGKPATITIEFTEYRPVGGTLVPFHQVHSLDDEQFLSLELSSADLTTNVDDALFYRPDRPYEMHLAKSIALPFEYSHKEILVKARINEGEPQEFLFDTAASQTVIDRRTAAEYMLDRQGRMTVNSAAGLVPTQMTTIDTLELAEIKLHDVQAIVLELVGQSRQLGRPIAGIIGHNVLSKFAVTIDFSKSMVVLHDATTYTPPAGAVIVPFSQQKGPIIKVSLNGGPEQSFLIDTGAAFNNMPYKMARPFIGSLPVHFTEGTGLDGRPVKLATVTIPSVRVGSQTARQVNFTYTVEDELTSHLDRNKSFLQTSNMGVLGNPFWQNHIMTLDYKFNRLILQPNTVVTTRQEIDQALASGDEKMTVHHDYRSAEQAYQRALLKAQSLGDPKLQARVWGRLGALHRLLAKDLNRPEQARIAYEYFSKAQAQAHKLVDREGEGRILADWSLLYMDNGQMPAARQALEGAVLYAPQDAQVNVDFAVYLYKLQLYPDMQRYVEKALFLDPTNWQALWYKVKLAELFNDGTTLKNTLKEICKYYPWSKLARDKYAALTAPPPVVPTNTAPPGGLQP